MCLILYFNLTTWWIKRRKENFFPFPLKELSAAQFPYPLIYSFIYFYFLYPFCFSAQAGIFACSWNSFLGVQCIPVNYLLGDLRLMLMTCFFAACSSGRIGIRCSYAAASINEEAYSGTIDVKADVKTERVREWIIPLMFFFYITSWIQSLIFVCERVFYFLFYQIVVLGGSGFVGSAICKAAVSKGIEVVSLSRCKIFYPYISVFSLLIYIVVNWLMFIKWRLDSKWPISLPVLFFYSPLIVRNISEVHWIVTGQDVLLSQIHG